MDEKMRAEFEAWWREENGNRLYCESAWRGWQASRAALVVELPERINKESGYSEDDEYYNLALDHCRSQIEAAGVRMKP